MKTRNKLRRLIASLTVSAVALSGSVLLAPMSKAADVELTMYSWRVEDKAFYEDVIKSFTASNPGIKITFQSFPSADYQTILMSAMAAGKGPDIVHVRSPRHVHVTRCPTHNRRIVHGDSVRAGVAGRRRQRRDHLDLSIKDIDQRACVIHRRSHHTSQARLRWQRKLGRRTQRDVERVHPQLGDRRPHLEPRLRMKQPVSTTF